MANDMKALERLLGSWTISGGIQGECTYEWMDGGHFLIQRGRVVREDESFTYMQVIGYDHRPEQERGDEILGRLYTSNGDTLSYVCEIEGDDLTIWMGEKGSPAVYRGAFGDDDNTLTGGWVWPGGGYDEVMTRVT